VTLKYDKNAFADGAPPRTPMGELTTLPRSPSRPHPSRRLRRLYSRVFGARQPAISLLVFFEKSNTVQVVE